MHCKRRQTDGNRPYWISVPSPRSFDLLGRTQSAPLRRADGSLPSHTACSCLTLWRRKCKRWNLLFCVEVNLRRKAPTSTTRFIGTINSNCECEYQSFFDLEVFRKSGFRNVTSDWLALESRKIPWLQIMESKLQMNGLMLQYDL